MTGPPSEAESGPVAAQPVTLTHLLQLVEKACRGDQALSRQLFSVFMQMRLRPNTPANERALADILIRILIGEREPPLESLDAEDHQPVRELLQRLGARNPSGDS